MVPISLLTDMLSKRNAYKPVRLRAKTGARYTWEGGGSGGVPPAHPFAVLCSVANDEFASLAALYTSAKKKRKSAEKSKKIRLNKAVMAT